MIADPPRPDTSPSDPPDLSVLIVTYRSAGTIEACLDSLSKELEHRSAEIVVVDNASTDDTPQILDIWAAAHANIQVQHNRVNRGFAVGNNQALELATGRDILVLNPDTLVQPGATTGLLTALHDDETLGAVAPQLRFPDGRVQRTCRRFPRHSDVIFHVLGLSVLYPQSRLFNHWKMGDFDHQSISRNP